MSRRIEIELTSRAGDGSWTWRAAGAKQPRGTLEASLAPGDAAVGSVYRAEVEIGIDGIDVISLGATKGPSSSTSTGNRIEVVGPARREPGVSVTLLAGSRGGRDGRDGRDGDRSRRRDRDGEGGGRGGAGGPGGPSRGDRRGRDRDDRDRDREGAGAGAGAGAGGERGRRPSAGGPSRGPRREGDDRRGRDGAAPTDRRPKRPAVSTTHRNAMLAALRPEQLPVAEQLLRGGIPAVRQAIAEQNAAAARSSGSPPASSDALLAMAEELLPVVRLAEWKDRATTALNAGRELRLRELRTVVTGSRTVTLDEEGRAMAKSLSESLDARVTALRQEWVSRVESLIAQDKVAEALEVSGHPPEHGTRCPAELAVSLADAAGKAMTAEADPLAWQTLLEAVMESPVRRTVKPTGIPDDEHAVTAARHAAGAVPELAKLLGLRIPPPPPRRTVVRRNLTPATSPAGGGGAGAGAGSERREAPDVREASDA